MHVNAQGGSTSRMTSPRPETSDTRRLANITEGVIPPRQSQRHSAMAADVLSPRSEPSVTSPNANRTSLPPLVTSPPSKAKLERASSYVSKRLSTFSNASASQSVSRLSCSAAPLLPLFHSSEEAASETKQTRCILANIAPSRYIHGRGRNPLRFPSSTLA